MAPCSEVAALPGRAEEKERISQAASEALSALSALSALNALSFPAEFAHFLHFSTVPTFDGSVFLVYFCDAVEGQHRDT